MREGEGRKEEGTKEREGEGPREKKRGGGGKKGGNKEKEEKRVSMT